MLSDVDLSLIFVSATPGTLMEDKFLHPRQNNFLAAVTRISRNRDELVLAWLDVSTGEFRVSRTSLATFHSELLRLAPKEILVSENIHTEMEPIENVCPCVHVKPVEQFTKYISSLERTFKNQDSLRDLTEVELGVCGLLVDYVQDTLKGVHPQLCVPKRFTESSVMRINAVTRKALELTAAFTNDHNHTLLAVMDNTVTGTGARLLLQRLNTPLLTPELINARLDEVEAFVQLQEHQIENIRRLLRECHDLERCLQRLSFDKGGPRDLESVAVTLSQTKELEELLNSLQLGGKYKSALKDILQYFGSYEKLSSEIRNALVQEPPVQTQAGNFIAKGYSAQLDNLRELRDDIRGHMISLQDRYRTETQISKLKVKQGKRTGYFVEVPIRHQDSLPPQFTPIQCLASGYARFVTKELAELESKHNHADSEALELEHKLFNSLSRKVLAKAPEIRNTAHAIARLDVACGLGLTALQRNYCRPTLHRGADFLVKSGRHPVVETVRSQNFLEFASNDLTLNDEQRVWLITGPNMGGKSTFLRQNALIAILAQMGSFVPADSVGLGIVDQVFCRVGASDDIASNRSTFFMEMQETSCILHEATSRSLVIMDEIGRGTGPHDGYAIAKAVLEYLQHLKCRTLFATHYQQLGKDAATHAGVSCYQTSIHKHGADIVFTHKVVPGIADRSYGIEVAALAGVPEQVLRRARHIVQEVSAQ